MKIMQLTIIVIESFVPLLASLGVSQNMPLSQVICVTHYTGFPFGSASFTELLCWYGTVLSALPQFTCRNSVDLCRPWCFWWQTLSSPCKHLDYTASCILSCCSFYLEFTSLADSAVTKELHAFALQAA